MKDLEQLCNKTHCCGCDRPMTDSRHHNFMAIPYAQTWKDPQWGNALDPVAHRRLQQQATTLLCDACIQAQQQISEPVYHYAIEIRDDMVLRHPVIQLASLQEEDDGPQWHEAPLNIEVRETDLVFTTSPDPGPDCLCSRCGKPILHTPIRAW